MTWPFKRKNRRLDRRQVLDVKLRAGQGRALRFRKAAAAFTGAFVLVLVILGTWFGGDWALRRLVFENPAFSVKVVDVATDGGLPVEAIRRWTGVRMGDNLLALDLPRIQSNLRTVPTIESASLERVLPGTLRVRVVERVPVARVVLFRVVPGRGVEQEVSFVDPSGHVMQPIPGVVVATPAGSEEADLPQITGVTPALVRAGARLTEPRMVAALRFLECFEESSLFAQTLVLRIDVSQPEVITVTTGDSCEVTLAADRFEEQLARWDRILAEARRAGKSLAWIDLSVMNNVPARWVDETEAQPVIKPKAPPSARTRRKHV